MGRMLLTREGEIFAEKTSSSNLARELSRVRRDFIVSTSNRSEQQSALLGGRTKGSAERRLRARHGSVGGGSTSAWALGMSASTTKSSKQALSRLESSAFEQAREGASCDDVFLSKVNASSKAPRRNGHGLNNGGMVNESGNRHPLGSSSSGVRRHDTNKYFVYTLNLVVILKCAFPQPSDGWLVFLSKGHSWGVADYFFCTTPYATRSTFSVHSVGPLLPPFDYHYDIFIVVPLKVISAPSKVYMRLKSLDS